MIHQYILYLAYTKGYSNNTLKSYTQALTQFVNYRKQCDSNARWSTTTAGDVQNYLGWLKECEKSNATIHLHSSAIKGMFRFIVHNGGTIDKAIYHVECPKMVKSDVATIAPADIEDTIADTSLSIDTRLIIALIADSGLRISEVLSLRPLDFDKSSMTITIAGKGGKTRYCYYSTRVQAMLNAYKRDTHRDCLLFNGDERMIRYNIHMALRKHSNAPKLSPHIIRHTFATEMLCNGLNLAALKKQLGHEDIKSTERYLNHYRLHSYNSYKSALGA